MMSQKPSAGMLILYLVSMFRGDSELTISSKNKHTVVHFENVREPPPSLVVSQKLALLDEG